MKFHLRYVILSFCVFFFLSGCSWNAINEKELNQFIESENLDYVSIQKLNDEEYYIFSLPYIYIYRSASDYTKSTAMIRDEIAIGGLEKGSIGLVINNTQVLKDAKTFSVVIDSKTREYEYTGGKYLIIKDSRIWNPTAQLKIIFSNDKNETIFESDY
jgi:hypothetical protein